MRSLLKFCVLAALLGFGAPWAWSAPLATFTPQITASDRPNGISNGATVTVDITLVHNGAAGSYQAELQIPAAYDFLDANACGGSVVYDVDTHARIGLIWPTNPTMLATGNNATCSTQLRANTVTSNDVATVTAYRGPVSGGTQTGQVTYTFLPFTPKADMQITAAASKSPVAIGDSADFTFVATNNGPQGATGIGASLTFPSSFSLANKSCAGATFGSNSVSWPVGSLAAGASATCVITGSPQSGAGSTAIISASVNASTPSDPNTGNNMTSTSVAVVAAAQADLQIVASASKPSVAVGEPVDFIFLATDNGPQGASGVTATLTFPSTVSLAVDLCFGGTINGSSVTWPIGAMSVGPPSAMCAITATPLASAAGSTVMATGSVVAASPTDPSTGNNTSRASVMVTAAPSTDLGIAMRADPTTLLPGGAVTFTLTASNLGSADAPATRVSAQFPAQLQLQSADCVTGTPNNAFTWNIGTFAAGTQPKVCLVRATLSEAATTSFAVTAGISSAIPDPQQNNDSATVNISVQQSQAQNANLAVQLGGVSAGKSYKPGDTLHLTVSASDTSGAAASNVTTSVHVRNRGDLNGLHADCGTFTASGDLTWTIDTLPGGNSKFCSIDAVVAGTSRTIPVSASVTSANLGNDLAHLTDVLLVPVSPLPRQISVPSSGAATTRDSTHVALSQDGSSALFQSRETDIVSGNANGSGQDIYRVTASAGATLETLDASGHALLGTASLPAISGDGSLVAFNFSNTSAKQAKDGISITGQMYAGASGQNKHPVDMGLGGAAPNGTSNGAPSVTSINGVNRLVFCSSASNLVSGDNNGGNDVFLVDPSDPTQATLRISTDASGQQLPGDSCEPKLSADGTKVVFTLSAPSLFNTAARQVVRKDLVSGALDLISVANGAAGNADSSEPTLNADGSVVAFTSQANNLDGLGTPVGGREVFLSVAQNGAADGARTLRRVRSGDGTVPNGSSQHAQVSGSGDVLVMQTFASNFFGMAKADTGTAACGAVAITTNFFAPAALGSSLCGGQTSNQNPAISGDGTVAGFDSNAPQPGTTSSNSNAYTQPVASGDGSGAVSFGDDFSGQWYDDHQSGQGLVVDVLPPDPGTNTRRMLMEWFVTIDGSPTWMQAVGPVQTDAGGNVVVPMQAGIFRGKSFPIGEDNASAALWGNITLTFADANTGVMTWTSTYPGFNAGTMQLTRLYSVHLPQDDAPGALVGACQSGNWNEVGKSGHGFEFEITPAAGGGTQFAADWFTFDPNGAPVWLYGGGPIHGDTVTMQFGLVGGTGAQFPPLFDAAHITQTLWGTVTVKFNDATHAHLTWSSTIPGYGSGAIDLQQGVTLDRRSCH